MPAFAHRQFHARQLGEAFAGIARDARFVPVSYTHLRAHETPEHLVCRLLLEKKKKIKKNMLADHLHLII